PPPQRCGGPAAAQHTQPTPPATNDAIQVSGKPFTRQVDKLPPADVLAEIDREVDMAKLEHTLMEEGIKKFADPQKHLLALIAEKRKALAGGRRPAEAARK